jgi:hypothetical protein
VGSEVLVYVIVAMTLSSLLLLLPVAIHADRAARAREVDG